MADTSFAPVPIVETELSPFRSTDKADNDDDDDDTVASTPPGRQQQQQGGGIRRPHFFRTTYRGGFATSICDLFSNPYDRSSFCALVCCGIFLQHRTRYILHGGNLPAPRMLSVRLPILVVALVVTFSLLIHGHPISFIVLVSVLSIRGTLLRMKIRQQIMQSVVPEHRRRVQNLALYSVDDNNSNNNDEDGCCCNSCCTHHRRAHRCCAIVPVDVIYEPIVVVSTVLSDQQPLDDNHNNNDDHTRQRSNDTHHHHHHHHDNNNNNNNKKDSCYYLWRFLAASCCGSCGCWCNCCGVCATAQEDREMRRHYPRDKFMMDYITMQPYADYYPAIQALRDESGGASSSSSSGLWWTHFGAMSKLSVSLCRLMGLCLLVLLAVSAFHIFSNFRLVDLIVVFLTLFQAFAVVYLVHWRNHRFDLSLDAVVKFFASGFILAASAAMMIELITETIGDLGAVVLLLFSMDENEDISNETQEEIVEDNLLVMVLVLFFRAFVTAALVEELTKFFCFWIVEHPDLSFIPQDPLNKTTGQDNNGDSEEDEQIDAWDVNSKAAAVTVGMVTTAAGFACMENLLYALGVGKSVSSGKPREFSNGNFLSQGYPSSDFFLSSACSKNLLSS